MMVITNTRAKKVKVKSHSLEYKRTDERITSRANAVGD